MARFKHKKAKQKHKKKNGNPVLVHVKPCTTSEDSINMEPLDSKPLVGRVRPTSLVPALVPAISEVSCSLV